MKIEDIDVNVNVSVEDKEEIAKDILGMVLIGLNEVISDAIQTLQNPLEIEKEEVLENIIVEQFQDVTRDLNSKAFGI